MHVTINDNGYVTFRVVHNSEDGIIGKVVVSGNTSKYPVGIELKIDESKIVLVK